MSALVTRIERKAGRALTPTEIFNISASRETLLPGLVHIRYFGVRDREGKYLGTLALTQDTPLRALTGERRLLQYN